MASIELTESVYITQLMSSFFFISLIAILIADISAVWKDSSSGNAPHLVMSANIAAMHTFLLVLFDHSV